MQRHRGVQRIADNVAEVEAPEAPRLGEATRVDEHHGAQRLGTRPERLEAGVRQLQLADMGQDLDTFEAQHLDAMLEFLGCRGAPRLQRHRTQRRRNPIRQPRGDRGDAFVDHPGGLNADLRRHAIIALARRRTDDLGIQSHRIEVAHPQRQVGQMRRAVGILPARQNAGFLGVDARPGVRLQMRPDQIRGRRNRHMAVDIDGQAGWPAVPPRPPMIARGGQAVLISRFVHRTLLPLVRGVSQACTSPGLRHRIAMPPPRCPTVWHDLVSHRLDTG